MIIVTGSGSWEANYFGVTVYLMFSCDYLRYATGHSPREAWNFLLSCLLGFSETEDRPLYCDLLRTLHKVLTFYYNSETSTLRT